MRAIVAALMLSACTTMPAGPEAPDAGGRRCDSSELGDLIGREATSALGTEAMRRSGARTLRWIRPGDAVTMDYSEHRLNIMLDSANRVAGFSCG